LAKRHLSLCFFLRVYQQECSKPEKGNGGDGRGQ
jgi:hypothetical protein